MTYIRGARAKEMKMDIQDTLEFAKLLRGVVQVAKKRVYTRADILVTLETIAYNYEREAARIEAQMEKEAA